MKDMDILKITYEKLAELEREREQGKIDDLTYQVESGKLNRIINNLT